MRVKSKQTLHYAQSEPHLPLILLVQNETYSDQTHPVEVLKKALEIGAAVEIEGGDGSEGVDINPPAADSDPPVADNDGDDDNGETPIKPKKKGKRS